MPYLNMVMLIAGAAIVLILLFLVIFLLFKAKDAVLAVLISVVLILLLIGGWYILNPVVQAYLKLAEYTAHAEIDEGMVLRSSVVLVDSLNSLNAALVAENEEQGERLSDYDDLLMQTDSTLATIRDSLEVERATRKKAIEELTETLAEEYEHEIQDGLVKIEQLENRRVKVSFDEKITFSTAQGQLNARGKKVLSKAAPQMRSWLEEKDKLIRIEGHTDRVPINTRTYPSNWELSAFRAASTVHFLNEELKLPAKQLEAAGLGESYPAVVSLPDRLDMAPNRRIEIYFESFLSRPQPDTLYLQTAGRR